MIDLHIGRQTFDFDCGAKALQTVMAYYGVEVREDELMAALGTGEQGTPVASMVGVARQHPMGEPETAGDLHHERGDSDFLVSVFKVADAFHIAVSHGMRQNHRGKNEVPAGPDGGTEEVEQKDETEHGIEPHPPMAVIGRWTLKSSVNVWFSGLLAMPSASV